MGIASIAFFMPHMTDIGHLLLLVAVGSFIAAWVSNGSNLIQYVGWQMALAFFLCVLQGFGPAFDIDVATNRILGILIGNVVVTIVFLWLWPVSVSAGTALHLGKAVEGLAAALRRTGKSLAGIMPELDAARRLSRLSAFEASRLRVRSPLLPHAKTIMDASQDAMASIARVQLLRARPRYLFGAPRCVKAATLAQEESAARFLDDAASAIVRPEPEARTMLDQSLSRSFDTLARLERVLAQTPRRASWRGDLEATTRTYRELLQGFAHSVEAL
jgi:multidrug resistance protein MdtO